MINTAVRDRKCPRCGARLRVERVDHNLAGNEKLVCPQHGTVGHLNDDQSRVYGRHRERDYDHDD